VRHPASNATPEDRLRAVAAILAKGIVRLRRNHALTTATPPLSKAPECGEVRLDVGAASSPHATNG